MLYSWTTLQILTFVFTATDAQVQPVSISSTWKFFKLSGDDHTSEGRWLSKWEACNIDDSCTLLYFDFVFKWCGVVWVAFSLVCLVYCGKFFYIILDIIIHDVSKVWEHIHDKSLSIMHGKLSLAVNLNVISYIKERQHLDICNALNLAGSTVQSAVENKIKMKELQR